MFSDRVLSVELVICDEIVESNHSFKSTRALEITSSAVYLILLKSKSFLHSHNLQTTQNGNNFCSFGRLLFDAKEKIVSNLFKRETLAVVKESGEPERRQTCCEKRQVKKA